LSGLQIVEGRRIKFLELTHNRISDL